ncbi:hypothetical protein GWK91_03340 [Virgibacillus sp. MSP4-1]|uniref:hypothetical protein n=1 Tax=Virgibacillus sp. MSP4-1 TaxID=2700081 RepID=UPI0005C6AC44|nr:hypothetical protein [Virgibacillus sp. MSP4-1]QHS22037.1 hypothetical protein GWK91_03340 [Virgibacillus sp. MSP4-1]
MAKKRCKTSRSRRIRRRREENLNYDSFGNYLMDFDDHHRDKSECKKQDHCKCEKHCHCHDPCKSHKKKEPPIKKPPRHDPPPKRPPSKPCEEQLSDFIGSVAELEEALAHAIKAEADQLRKCDKKDSLHHAKNLEDLLKHAIKKEIVMELLLDDIVDGCKHTHKHKPKTF